MPTRSRDRLRVVVAGGGRATQQIHLPTLLAHRELFEVAGVADPVHAVRADLARRFGLGDAVYSGVDELLALEADALDPRGADRTPRASRPRCPRDGVARPV